MGTGIKGKAKTYFNVMELSEAFAAWQEEKGDVYTSSDLHEWQVRFQLAIAQQLTMIAQHLGKIVANAAKVE